MTKFRAGFGLALFLAASGAVSAQTPPGPADGGKAGCVKTQQLAEAEGPRTRPGDNGGGTPSKAQLAEAEGPRTRPGDNGGGTPSKAQLAEADGPRNRPEDNGGGTPSKAQLAAFAPCN